MNYDIQADYKVQGSDMLNYISHNDKSIEFIQTWSDGGYFIVKNQIFTIAPGSIMIINAIDNHYSNPKNPDTYTRSKLIIPNDLFEKIVSLLDIESFADDNIMKTGGCSFLFESGSDVAMKIDRQLQNACIAFNENNENCTAHIVTSVINILLLILSNQNRQIIFKKKRTIDQLADYINMHQDNWDYISLENICKGLNISSSRATHLFKELTGLTITSYRNQLRISEAKKLLLSTNLKIYEISDMLNFDQCTIFNKYFKKAVGCTPNEYRMSNGVSSFDKS